MLEWWSRPNSQGWRPVPNTPFMGMYSNGRESGLKIHPVWVRIPPSLPRTLRVRSKARTVVSKITDVSSILTPSAIKTHTAILFKDHSVKMTHLKCASRLLYGAIVYGARAPRQCQEWVQFPRNPVYMGGWYTGLVHLTENQRTSVRLGPRPPLQLD